MSCLYSSPEFTNLGKLLTLHCRRHGRFARSGHAHHAPRIAAPFQFQTDFAVRRGQQRHVPQQSGVRRRPHQIIPPAKTSTGFLREFSSAISGFRSLCGRNQRSSFSHRAQLDLRFGTFHSGRALALRTLASARNIPTGYLRGHQPWTDVVSGT